MRFWAQALATYSRFLALARAGLMFATCALFGVPWPTSAQAGSPCTDDWLCESKACKGGACCDGAASNDDQCGSCARNCDVELGSDSACTQVEQASDSGHPFGTCNACESDGAGNEHSMDSSSNSCKKVDGSTCTLPSECLSSSCAGGRWSPFDRILDPLVVLRGHLCQRCTGVGAKPVSRTRCADHHQPVAPSQASLWVHHALNTE
jgi:hypothetical protein